MKEVISVMGWGSLGVIFVASRLACHDVLPSDAASRIAIISLAICCICRGLEIYYRDKEKGNS